MPQRNHIALAVLTLLVGFPVLAGSAPPESKDYYTATGVEDGRNLAHYAQTTPFDCGYCPTFHNLDNPKPEQVKAAAREFLWNHWRLKSRAYAKLTYHTVDAGATTHVFIEPDAQGRWRAVVRMIRNSGEVIDRGSAVDISWSQPAKTDSCPYMGSGTRPRVLVLRDEHGSIIETL